MIFIIMELISEDDINIILRQTNYTREEAEQKLTECKNDKIKVIKQYLEISENTEKKLTENQKRIKDFREILKDTVPLKTNV